MIRQIPFCYYSKGLEAIVNQFRILRILPRRVCISGFVQVGSQFPTPALSPRESERENCPQSVGAAKAIGISKGDGSCSLSSGRGLG